MSRFHIGDRVRVKSNTRYNYYYAAEITEIEDFGVLYFIVCDDNGYKSSAFEEQVSHLADGMFVCEHCGEVITENHGDDNHILCKDCRDSGDYTTCRECGCLINTRCESYLCYEDEYICAACRDTDGWEVCADCGRLVQSEDYETDDEGTIVCNDCFRENWTHCDDCGCLVRLSDAHYDDYVAVCDWCFDERWAVCEDCGNLFNVENEGGRINDSFYCGECVVDHRNIIHEYDYKPYPEFYGLGRLFLGVELEIDDGGEDDENAEQLECITGDEMYYKHDSSLKDGFECVTHPMTLKYHRYQFPWADLCKKAASLGYKSHDAGTCGLHVHVSRNALGDNEDEQDATIARILYFFERNWDALLKFSRRTESQLNQWAARYTHKDTVDEYHEGIKNNEDDSRYMCVNLQNSNTIEFRIFRGTLKANTILATLELVERICVICTSCNADDMQGLSWEHFLSLIDPDEYQELFTYIKEREEE